MTKVAVTGASGFVGRYVLAALAKTDVAIVAHARTPRIETSGTASPRWSYFDIAAAPEDCFERLGRPDIVIHLAWDGLPNFTAPRHFENELPAQSHFLRGLIESGLRRLVVVGTCLEYGMQPGCLSEDMTALPSNPYGHAKDALRRELQFISTLTPFDLRWMRMFYLYGKGQAPKSLYSQFHDAVARGDKTFVMSPGDQVRDFLKVEDAADAIVDVALARKAPRILNVCSGRPTTVRGLVEQWRADAGADLELKLGVYPYPSYEPFAFWGDNSRLNALRGVAAGSQFARRSVGMA